MVLIQVSQHIQLSTVAAHPRWESACTLQQLACLKRENHRPSHVHDKKMQSTYCTPDISTSAATKKAPGKGSAEISNQLLLALVVEGPASCHSFTSPQRFSQSQCWIPQVLIPQSLPNRVPSFFSASSSNSSPGSVCGLGQRSCQAENE